MPAPSVIDLSPDPNRERTPLEKTLSSFAQREQENRTEARDIDALKEIYSQYQQDGQNIDNALMKIQTTPGLSPTRRVEAANNLLKIKQANIIAQKNQQQKVAAQTKADSKAAADAKKAQIEADLDEKELAFLEQIKGKNLRSDEIYYEARKAGIPRIRAKDISTLTRLENKEARLTEADISKQYDYEIKELEREIKDAGADDEKKEPLQKKRQKLVNQRKHDINRFKKGERDFELTLDAEQRAMDEQETALQEAQNQLIGVLQQTFPPAQFNGQSKWIPADKSPDGKKHQYKSDGTKWILVQ